MSNLGDILGAALNPQIERTEEESFTFTSKMKLYAHDLDPVRALWQSGHRVMAIKLLYKLAKCDVKTARDWCENYADHPKMEK